MFAGYFFSSIYFSLGGLLLNHIFGASKNFRCSMNKYFNLNNNCHMGHFIFSLSANITVLTFCTSIYLKQGCPNLETISATNETSWKISRTTIGSAGNRSRGKAIEIIDCENKLNKSLPTRTFCEKYVILCLQKINKIIEKLSYEKRIVII